MDILIPIIIAILGLLFLTGIFFFRTQIYKWIVNNKKKVGAIVAATTISSAAVMLIPTGDPPEEPIPVVPEPYFYNNFTAPPNSFGIGDTTFKHVNISFYRDWLNGTISWSLEKSLDNVYWVDAGKLLKVEKIWDDQNLSEKHTLIISSDEDAYYRLLLRTDMDKQLMSYNDVSKDNRFDLDFKVTTSEWYNISYNWSDFKGTPEYSKANLITSVSTDISNKKQLCWDVYTTMKIKVDEKFSIDPWFGYQGEGGTSKDLQSYTYASAFEAPENGEVTHIAWYVDGDADSDTLKAAIYDTSNNLLGQGTSDSYTHGLQWVNVSLDSSVSVTSGISYYLAGRAEVDTKCYYSGDAPYWYDTNSYAVFPENPATPAGSGSRQFCVFATYTESGGEEFTNVCPVATGEQPSNSSTSISLTPACGVTLTDGNSNHTFNVTYATNQSGSYVNMQTNSSVGNNTATNWTYLQANSASSHYFWRVYVHDGICNQSFTFSFTTAANGTDFTNICPVASGPQPSNGSIDEIRKRAVGCTLSDSNANHTYNVTFASNYTGSWVNYQTNSSVANNTAVNWTFSGAEYYHTWYWWRVYAHDGICNASYTFNYKTICLTYTETVRNDGIDYFVYRGRNITVSDFVGNITGFDEEEEYIAIWENGTWDATNGNWKLYYGDGSGADFTLNTTSVVRLFLNDSSGTSTINMTENEDMNYTLSKTIPLRNTTTNKGFNYSGYNQVASTDLSTINGTGIGLEAGEYIALWNETNYAWDFWLVGFWETNKNVHQWDVIVSKVADTETWTT